MGRKFRDKPTKGTEIATIWRYVVVSVDIDLFDNDKWHALEMSKHRTLTEARECADQHNDSSVQYAKQRGYPTPKRREFYVAEWTTNVRGEIVLVLIDDVDDAEDET